MSNFPLSIYSPLTVVKNVYKVKIYYWSRKLHGYIYESIFCSVCACVSLYIPIYYHRRFLHFSLSI